MTSKLLKQPYALLFVLAANPSIASPEATAVLRSDISTERNEYNLSTSDDRSVMVLARSDADFAGARIMVAERRGKDWSAPIPIEFSDPRYRDSDPWLTPDGGTLYFVSDRPTAARPEKRDLDIWRSERRNGRWQSPVHLGDLVNGKGDELGPELHNGTLFFAAARKSGLGGLDIYAAQVSGMEFGTPKLLPSPVNSAASESDFTLSPDGQTALFWRQVGKRGLLHVSLQVSDGVWSEPKPMPNEINIGPFNFTPSISPDGRRLTYASTAVREGQAPGMADLYEAPLLLRRSDRARSTDLPER